MQILTKETKTTSKRNVNKQQNTTKKHNDLEEYKDSQTITIV